MSGRNPRRGVHSHMTGTEFREDQHACRVRRRTAFALGTFTDGRKYRVIKHPRRNRAGTIVDYSDQLVLRWPKVRGKKARAADKRARMRGRLAA